MQLYLNCTDWQADLLMEKWLPKFQDYFKIYTLI